MKRHSMTTRLVAAVLLMEFALAALTTTVELLYLRDQHLRTFDIMLRGRADSVFGAVQDAEDPADNVLLDTTVLDLPTRDVYQVWEENGRLIGRSPNWSGLPNAPSWPVGGFQPVRVNGQDYRGLALHLTRNIDPDDKGPGIAHKIVLVYAAPVQPIRHALYRETRLLALGNSLLLLLTGAAVAVVLRRGMAPLRELAIAATGISADAWEFKAPAAAYGSVELFPLANALNTAVQRLERSFRQQQTFVSDAAHELKTAVTIVQSSLQLLAYKERSAAEYHAGLELCLADCSRLEDLVAKMLRLAGAEQGELAPRLMGWSRTDLGQCVRQVCEEVGPLVRLRRVELRAESFAGATTALGAADCMTVLTNLLVNAVQHTEAGCTVEVVSSATGFVVRDRGEGISNEALPFVFDRFYREDRSRARNSGGAGLGLAICKALLTRNGGNISIESRQGEGTTVRVELPGFARSEGGAEIAPELTLG